MNSILQQITISKQFRGQMFIQIKVISKQLLF